MTNEQKKELSTLQSDLCVFDDFAKLLSTKFLDECVIKKHATTYVAICYHVSEVISQLNERVTKLYDELC